MSDASHSEPELCVFNPRAEASNPEKKDKGKPRPKLFRALGKAEPPAEVEVSGSEYQLVNVLKHDSWAATAIYASEREKIVCKFNRQQAIGLLPMKWLGRWLAGRENYLLRKFGDLPNVPDYRGPVNVNGQPQDNVASHVFIEGHPLHGDDVPNDAFFAELQQTLATMHRRGVVYVDLHKGENILLGDDERAYLIDFQVCFIRPRGKLLGTLLSWAESMLRDMDHYHFRKHLCHHRPDLSGCTLVELNERNERPWWIKVHRSVAVPLRGLRRRFLVAIGIRKGEGKAETEHFAEDAIRRRAEASAEPLENRKAA